MKKITLLLILLCTQLCFASTSFTDSCGRTVELPDRITRVCPAGPAATVMMESIAPEYLCSINSSDVANKDLQKLPVTGSFHGGKSSFNIEEIMLLHPDVIIDMGDRKNGIEAELNNLQKQMGIPCIFIESNPDCLARSIRTLGTILYNKEDRAGEIAGYAERILKMAENCRLKIKDSEKQNVLYTGNADGFGANAKGTPQAKVLEIIGAENAAAVEKPVNKTNGNRINAEQLYIMNPDIILFAPESIYKTVSKNRQWKVLSAVKNGKYYEVPADPYNWMGSPASLNSLLGIIWLGNIVYPQYYDYNVDDMINEAKEILWNIKASN